MEKRLLFRKLSSHHEFLSFCTLTIQNCILTDIVNSIFHKQLIRYFNITGLARDSEFHKHYDLVIVITIRTYVSVTTMSLSLLRTLLLDESQLICNYKIISGSSFR